jgi:hypothetical protein
VKSVRLAELLQKTQKFVYADPDNGVFEKKRKKTELTLGFQQE